MTTNLSISVAPRPKSKSQQLATLLPGIEAALTEGHSHEVIHDHIKNTVGLDLSYQYYKTTLKRIRKKKVLAKAAGAGRPPIVRQADQGLAAIAQPVSDARTAPEQPTHQFTYDVKASINDFFS